MEIYVKILWLDGDIALNSSYNEKYFRQIL